VKAIPRFAALLLAAAALGTLVSCRYGLGEAFGRPSPVDERVVDPLAAAPAAPIVADPDNYVFVMVSDTHFRADADPAGAAGLATFLALLPDPAEFVIVGGDLADAGLPEEYARYDTWAATLGIPVCAAVGNHDLYNGGWTTFRTTVGASHY
jgi:hypothetical protein